MSLKQQLEQLREEAKFQGLSEIALWLDNKLKNDLIPALNLLEQKASNIPRDQELIASVNLLEQKINDLTSRIETLENP